MDTRNEPAVARAEMAAMYQDAYAANPGLEGFNRCKKRMLWLWIGVIAAQKLVMVQMLPDMPPGATLMGVLLALSIPGMVALAVYRGPWKFSLVLYLLALPTAVDLLANGLPALLAGLRYPPLFYVVLAVQAANALCPLVLALWLTVPESSRAHAQVINQTYRACLKRMKELADARR